MFHNHIVEVLERFHTFSTEDRLLAFVMYENFVKLTDALKTKGRKIINILNLPIILPDNMYHSNENLMQELRELVNDEDLDGPRPLTLDET